MLVVTWGELRNCQAWIFNATLHSKPMVNFRDFYLAKSQKANILAHCLGDDFANMSKA